MSLPQSPAPELRYHSTPSSVNPLGQMVFTFVCTNLCELLRRMSSVILPWGLRGSPVTALCRALVLAAVTGLCLYPLCFLWVMAVCHPVMSFTGFLPRELLPGCGLTRSTPPGAGGWSLRSRCCKVPRRRAVT